MNTAQLRVDIDKVTELERELGRLTDIYGDGTELFEIYAAGVRFRLRAAKTRLREAASVGGDDDSLLWIRLVGPAIGHGTGSLETITTFLERFRIAAKHAVSALEGVPYTGGRFMSFVESATSFQLVATAPGSFQIGLTAASASAKDDHLSGQLFDRDVVLGAIQNDFRQQALGMEGIRVLVDALTSPSEPATLERLRAELNDHGLLRVLYHARSLFPRGIDGIEFHGGVIGTNRFFSSETRDELKKLGENLAKTERYIGGVGIFQAGDLARNTMRLDFASVPDFPDISHVSGEYPDELKDTAEDLYGRPVVFSGTLRFDAMGQPQKVAFDYFGPIKPE